MKKTSKIILITIIATSILLGLGYAAIQNITLNITGTASADPNQSNFKVRFLNNPAPEVSDSTLAVAGITDDVNATINVSGLTERGQNVTATYTIENSSTDLSADLAVLATNNNPEYFSISSRLAKTSLVAGEKTTVTVTVELSKTLVSNSESATIGIQLTAIPVEPGNEGSSGLTNNYSQAPVRTLGELSLDNLGEYINLGNDLVGTSSTTDDWRIGKITKEGIGIILADYLPVSKLPVNSGLNTNSSYGIWANTQNELFTSFTNQSLWAYLANGVQIYEVYATPATDDILDVYNAIANTDYGTMEELMISREELGDLYDLCFPHESTVDNCNGYWTRGYKTTNNIWYLNCVDGSTSTEQSTNQNIGIRPCIILPGSLEFTYIDGVITLK